MAEKVGIYIHIPFCRSKCDYCDFYSLAGREERMEDYQKALLVHLKETAPFLKECLVDSVYFGGGTPSYYGAKRIAQLLAAVRRGYPLTRDAELTMEANPDSVDEPALRKLRRAGINRLSLGVQSACEGELKALHRPHTFQQVGEAATAIRGAKLENLSLDLIYGLPGQEENAWRRTVEEALALEPEHLSCYGLKVEEGTPLALRVAAGERLPEGDWQADCYLWTVERLARAGYYQYEISNFARAGFQSRHNLKYWMGKPYLGFGPGAHSDFGERRYSFRRDLEGYISGVLGGGDLVEEDELIPKRERGGEYLMLRLRTARGIEEWEYRREFGMNFEPLEQKLIQYERQGWAVRHDCRWKLTPKGFLVSNQLIVELLEAQEKGTFSELLLRAKKEIGTSKTKDCSV